jgi:hypothetical protein
MIGTILLEIPAIGMIYTVVIANPNIKLRTKTAE